MASTDRNNVFISIFETQRQGWLFKALLRAVSPFNSPRSSNPTAAGFVERHSTFVLDEASELGCPPDWLLRERYHHHHDWNLKKALLKLPVGKSFVLG